MRVARSAFVAVMIAYVAATGCSSCFSPVCDANDEACLAAQSVPGATRCENYRTDKEEVVCVVMTPVVCAGTECASGEDCCLTTGKCFDAKKSPDACPRPQASSTPGAVACAANSHCRATEACAPDDPRLCLGLGHCMPRNNCGFCTPPGSERCSTCGCNGVTYESIQAACVAGVPIAAVGACGIGADTGLPRQIGCGNSGQCPDGGLCCARTGECYAPAQPWRCETADSGAAFDCQQNADCGGTGGTGGTDRYCAGDGCGTPGTCKSRPTQCGGELSSVCGCDGRTYTNDCWARNAGTRVGSVSACDGG